ncbi:hypothetical protein FKP32DRAFT_1617567 [Trametes sanguinea]|nr:hypothetical protein FKP32DRAFT_1617567 [Trametes sanguinea]
MVQDSPAQVDSDEVHIRNQLPKTLSAWRLPHLAKDESDGEAIWRPLFPFFEKHGYALWKDEDGFALYPDVKEERDVIQYASGFACVIPDRGINEVTGGVEDLFSFRYINPLCRPARTRGKQDVFVRVLSMGDRGQNYVDILKAIAMGPFALYSNNHVVPVFDFLQFEDITFGVFPKIGFQMRDAYDGWPKNSVGDVLDMILQCLEALSFIHRMMIAHMDAFKDNFLVQWHPESLKTGRPPCSRPRVYLTDFEVAVMFPSEVLYEECRVSGFPTGGSYPEDTKLYARPVPPEVPSGNPYDPFKLDVWQFGTSLSDFKSTIPSIDRILEDVRLPSAAARPSSFDALRALSKVLADIAPNSLMIPPEVVSRQSA